jgi:hypothetical protein
VRCESQARVPAVHERTGVAGEGACGPPEKMGAQARVPVPQCKRDAGSVNSKEVRVNKRDSPRISREIHIDRKQPLGVSLKGSSLAPLGAGQGEEPGSSERVR